MFVVGCDGHVVRGVLQLCQINLIARFQENALVDALLGTVQRGDKVVQSTEKIHLEQLIVVRAGQLAPDAVRNLKVR